MVIEGGILTSCSVFSLFLLIGFLRIIDSLLHTFNLFFLQEKDKKPNADTFGVSAGQISMPPTVREKRKIILI